MHPYFHRKSLLIGIASSAVLAFTSPARAYCQLTTCEDLSCAGSLNEGCEEVSCKRNNDGCNVDGQETFYQSPCLSFSVEQDSAIALGLSDAEFEDIVAEAFERWRQLDCGDGDSPAFEIAFSGVVDSKRNFTCALAPEANSSVWRFSPSCQYLDNKEDCWANGNQSYGFTSTSFSTENGEIFDADVELNSDGIENDFTRNDFKEVVLNIATHEAGHFLGIAHSKKSDALMAVSYLEARGSTLEREFTNDDIQAVCALFPPLSTPLGCADAEVPFGALNEDDCEELAQELESGGCNFRNTSPSNSRLWGGFSVLYLLALRRRKTRRGFVEALRL